MHAIELFLELVGPLEQRYAALSKPQINSIDALKLDFSNLTEPDRPQQVVSKLTATICQYSSILPTITLSSLVIIAFQQDHLRSSVFFF
jgi:hypothetical protein